MSDTYGFPAEEKTDDDNAHNHSPYETYSSFFSLTRKKKRNLAERLIKGCRALSTSWQIVEGGWRSQEIGLTDNDRR